MARTVNLAPDPYDVESWAPEGPRPADLFGQPRLPYPNAFYANPGLPPIFTPLTPQERGSDRQQQQQQNRQEVNLQGGETLSMGPNEEPVSLTLAGTAKKRGLSQVDPRLVQVIEAAAARSPYQVQVFSGKRGGLPGGSRHNTGNALDVALIDPTTGQVIPNYKSSTGFPIYAEFAKIAREEQMRLAPDMADQFRWGGGFSDQGFDLMHFDFKPGGAMAYWSWQDGGKLTAAGAEAVPKFGPGWVYANGQKIRAPEGQYASLWGNAPYQGPQDAQSAIASLQPPSGGTEVASPPSPLQGFQPTIPDAAFGTPAQAAIADLLAPAPTPAPFVPASGPIGPNFGPMLSPADVLNAGPRPRPAALSPVRPPMPNTTDRNLGVLPPTPMLRPGGAPQADMVPVPTQRPALGIPDPRMRPAGGPPPYPAAEMANMPPIGAASPVDAFFPSAGPLDLIPYSTQPPATAAPAIPGLDRSIIAGGNLGTPETAMSLETTFPPLSPAPPVSLDQRIADRTSFMDSRSLAAEMGSNRRDMERYTAPPFQSTVAARQEYPGSLPGAGPYFDNADPGPVFTPPSLAPDIRGRPEYPGSLPAAPPLQSMVAGRQEFPGSLPAAPAIEPVSAGPPPSPITQTQFDWRFGAGGPTPPPPPAPSPPSISMSDFDTRFGPTQPTVATGEDIILPGTQPGAGSQLPDEPPISYPSPMDVAIGEAGLGTPRQIRRNNPLSLPARIGNFILPGSPFGPGGGGSIFGIGPNGFLSNAGSFTPFTGPGAGGSSPFNQQLGGAMGATNWRHGSVTGNPNMQGTMWNRSGDNGSVGYVTDPFNPTTSMIYSGSPNRF